MAEKKAKTCPECRGSLIKIPAKLVREGWVCNKEDDYYWSWCDRPAKFVCKNWNVDMKGCATGRCGRHGEGKKRVEARKVRKA